MVAEEPILVGGGAGAGIDAVPFLDSIGRLVVPGTGAAGSLRAALLSTYGSDPLPLFGNSTDTGASRLSVDDVSFDVDSDDAGDLFEHRDGVAIDRTTGAAADGLKFDREVIPPGTRADIRLIAQLDADDARRWTEDSDLGDESALVWLGRLVSVLEDRGVTVGGGVSRGQGRMSVTTLEIRVFDLRTKDGILALASGSFTEVDEAGTSRALGRLRKFAGTSPTPTPTFTAHWHPVLPVFVARGHAGVSIDTWPLVVARPAAGSAGVEQERAMLLLPASSIKGALRSRAEWIVRTVAGVDAGSELSQQVPLVDFLFGAGGSADSGARRGALRFTDCVADLGMTYEQWREIEDIDRGSIGATGDESTANDPLAMIRSKLEAYRQKGRPPLLTPRAFTAIDRWTGGVSGSRLYSVLEPGDVEWSPIRITLDERLVPSDVRLACNALLLLLLDDLCFGEFGFGGRTTRGYGSIEITGWDATGFATLTGSSPERDGDDSELRTPLEVVGERRTGDSVEELARAFTAVVDSWRDSTGAMVTAGGQQ